MTRADGGTLAWPPRGVSGEIAAEAVRLLLRHHQAPEAPECTGALDDSGLAAAAGAEHLAGLARHHVDVADDVELLLRWLQDAGTAPQVDARVVAAVAEALDQVILGLRDRPQGRQPKAFAINAEAGQHAVVTDAVALRAAIRAGHKSLAEMPYYELRYGARGRRFMGSDSGWLVTLVDLTPQAVLGQVDWLAGVLATRGMPSLLLERHLTDLAAELSSATGHPRRWAPLRTAADHLADRRRTVVPDQGLQDAEDALRGALAGRKVQVPHAGALVAAAVADAETALTDDAEACAGWLADPQRFPQPWCDAIRHVQSGVATT